jgi:Ca2+-binding EF-hand superfamily protein
LLANTVSALNKVKDANDLPFSKIFQMLDHEGRNFVTKDQFTTSLLGMNLGVSSEDITELFNKIDEHQVNKIKLKQFKEVMEHLTSKLGGPSVLEASLQKGATQAKSKAPGTNL